MKRTLSMSLLACTFLAALGVAAQPASAAVSCNTYARYESQGLYYTDIPAIGTSGNINCVLGIGNQGSAVAALQRSLKACYVSGLAVDSIYGPATKAAVLTAQKDGGVTQDGVYGPVTQSHMKFLWRNLTTNANVSCAHAP